MMRSYFMATCMVFGACAQSATRDAVPATDLQQLRTATAPFQVLNSTIVAGYARTVKDCLVHEHHGAMGFHHVNSKLMDGNLELSRPEILLYERVTDGAYRLNGVEFIVPYRAWSRDSIAPQLMGRPLLREDNLKFWYLHVWAWRANPEGLFANFHPEVRCAADVSKVFRPSD